MEFDISENDLVKINLFLYERRLGELLVLLREIINRKKRGMAYVAKTSKLGRESLYKTLSVNGNPHISTIIKILDAMGLDLTCPQLGLTIIYE